MLADDWYGCYGKGWKGLSFQHPAKYPENAIDWEDVICMVKS